jgi:hypothetical protein
MPPPRRDSTARLTAATTVVALVMASTVAASCRAVAQVAPPMQDSQKSERAGRTPAQRKIDSQILIEMKRRAGGPDIASLPAKTDVKIDPKGRAFVDVRADVTPALRKAIESLGGTIAGTSVEYRSILAWIPLAKIEQLAEDPAVRAIGPAADAITNPRPAK